MLSLHSSLINHGLDTILQCLIGTAAQQKTSSTPSVIHDLAKVIPELFNDQIVSVCLLSAHRILNYNRRVGIETN